jgi:hypothetical protein
MFGTLALVLAQATSHDIWPIEINGMLCHPQRLMVKVEDMTRAHDLSERGYRVIQVFPKINWIVVESDPSRLQATRRQLSSEPGVRQVSFDRAARNSYAPNDAKWVDMWHARTIKADLAWDISFGTEAPVTIAIIDTGVNTAHPDLAANIWQNKDEIAANNIDDDGNGYIDDRNGYDFGYDDPIPNDVNGHGTACAGLAAAVQDNTIGVTGVAPKAKIMCLKASIDSGYFYDSNNVGAYLYALDNGAKVISCSFFSDRVSQSERDAIDALWAGGVLPVVAAGNDNSVVPFYPGAYENVVGVAATDQNNNRAGFSNFGSWVDVACPGVALRSTTAAGGYTDGFGGTSGACPQVAGLAALLFGSAPNTTNADVRACIEDTATALTTDFSKYGLINCEKAVQCIEGLIAPTMKSPKVNYMTPVIAAVGSGQFMNARICGRGFQAPRTIKIVSNGKYLPVYAQTRDYVDFGMPNGWSSISVFVDNVKILGFARPKTGATTYPLAELCTKGGSLNGGFTEISANDSVYATVGRRSDGLIWLNGTIRGVIPAPTMTIRLTRLYTGTINGTEEVFLYDWSSASYPYGNWVKMKTTTVPRTLTTTFISVPNASRFVDPEGTMYVQVSTNGTLTTGALKLDMLNIGK